MIEKLDSKMDCVEITVLGKRTECLGFDSAKEIGKKLNELCDVVNALIKENNIHEMQIDELQMKLEPEKCETPAENVQSDTESRPENVQKEPITLLDIFNEMGEMYSSLWNKMEDIHHDLKNKGGDND